MKSAKSKKISAPPAPPAAVETGHLSAVPQELVAERARSIWEQRGRPADQDLDIWLEAERQLSGKPLVRGDIKGKMDQPEADESLKSDIEDELDEETSGGSRRSATSL